jgi:hypothetical protein
MTGFRVANSYSGSNRCLKQTATMLLPSIVAKGSTRDRWESCTGASRRRDAVKRAVHVMHVVIVPEWVNLRVRSIAFQKNTVIEILAANGTDQPLDKWVRNRRVRNRLGDRGL